MLIGVWLWIQKNHGHEKEQKEIGPKMTLKGLIPECYDASHRT